MNAGLGRESRGLSLAICASGSSIGAISATRGRAGGGVRGGGPGGSGGKCLAPPRAPPLDPRAGGGGGGGGGPPIRGRTGGALGGGGGADKVVGVGGRTGGGGGATGGGGGATAGGGGGATFAGGGAGAAAGARIDALVGMRRPESEASSSVAARLSSSARADKPACVAASTARLSHTIASYFSPWRQSAPPVVSPHATSSASLSSGVGNRGCMGRSHDTVSCGLPHRACRHRNQ